MYSFLACLALLVIGFVVYSKIVDTIFKPTDEPTPAVRINDGVDYIPLPTWKVFMIQLLNIAGLGPIFGALGGALWVPAYTCGLSSVLFSPVAYTTICPA